MVVLEKDFKVSATVHSYSKLLVCLYSIHFGRSILVMAVCLSKKAAEKRLFRLYQISLS